MVEVLMVLVLFVVLVVVFFFDFILFYYKMLASLPAGCLQWCKHAEQVPKRGYYG